MSLLAGHLPGAAQTVAHAVVIALPSGPFGAGASPIIWTTDTDGKFAQDRFRPGTYYLWARHGEMLVVLAALEGVFE